MVAARLPFEGMADWDHIPKPTIKRLSLYLRELERGLNQGKSHMSSRELGLALGYADTQVRKDLGCFGQFGQSGVGYEMSSLAIVLRAILGKNQKWKAALIGAGKIGQALIGYAQFAQEGYEIVAVFDNDRSIVGTTIEGHTISPMQDLSRIIREKDILLGIVAVPMGAAQIVANDLVEAGVLGILNLAPVHLEVMDQVSVVSVDFTVAIEQLGFKVSRKMEESINEDA